MVQLAVRFVDLKIWVSPAHSGNQVFGLVFAPQQAFNFDFVSVSHTVYTTQFGFAWQADIGYTTTMSLLLGIIGERSSGKNTVSEYLAKKYGAFTISYSRILDEILGVLDQPISRRNEMDLGMALRGAFGPDVIARALRKRVLQASNDVIAIQSIRFPHEVKNAQDLGGHIVYLEAPLELRYDRAHKRREKADDNQTLEEFKEMTKEPTEIGIAALAKDAEFTIINNGTLEYLYGQVDEMMKQLKQ